MTHLEVALAYAHIGLHVFPVWEINNGRCACATGEDICSAKPNPSPGKHPRTKNGDHVATTDPAQITRWWTLWPEANIGISLEPSGLCVLDVDVGPGKKGVESLAEIEREHGPLPATRMATSGSGGIHAVYAQPKDLAPQRKIGFRDNLDLLSKGYIVAAPSRHVSGGTYVWANDLPVAPLPPVLRAVFSERPPERAPRAFLQPERVYPPASSAVLQSTRERLLRHGPAIQGQGGDAHTFQVGAILLRGRALSFQEAWPLVLEWNQTCQPPWSEAELVEKLRNGATYGQGVFGEERAPIEYRAAIQDLLQGIPSPAGDLLTGIPLPPPSAFSVALAEALAQVKGALGVITDTRDTEPLFEPAATLIARPYPQTPWVVEGMITEGGIVVVGGEPKTTKSWLATEVAMAVATGTKVFGEFSTKPMTSAYFFAEDLAPSVNTHLRALAAGRGLPVDVAVQRMHVQPRGRSLDLLRDEDVALVVASCRRMGPLGLLVLDPLRDIHSGEEDKADAMAPVMKRVRLIGNLLGCTVLFVHHMAKSSADGAKRRQGQKLRGSSVIHGSIDGGIYLSDLTGDGERVFTNQVQSEVKGAKSAGYYSVTLAIDDDAHGSAVKAAWTVERAKPAVKDNDADAQVLAAVARTPGQPKATLREVCGMKVAKADLSITRLLGTGALRIEDRYEHDAMGRQRKVAGIVLGNRASEGK